MALIEGIKIDLGNVWEGIGGLVSSIREAITGEPSPEKQAKAQAALMQMDFLMSQGQQKINEIEASHASIFVAGWRPFIGWVCGSALAWHYILAPFVAFGLTVYGKPIPLPVLDMGELMTLLMGLLGLGALRTYERTKGVART